MYVPLRSSGWTPVALVALLITGCGGPEPSDPSHSDHANTADRPLEPNRQQRLLSAERLVEQGDLATAAEQLTALLVIDPNDVEVVFGLATLRAQQGQLDQAVDLLDSIPADHPDAGLPALGQAADWCLEAGRYEDAESRLKRIITIAPESALAHRRLAHLLNRQGRRHEAAEHIHQLCQLGDFRQDELHALINLSDAMANEPADTSTNAIDYSPLGASGEARVLFTERKYRQAAERLRSRVAEGNAPPSMVAFYGRAVAEAQDDEQFRWWLGRVDDSTREFSEYWAAIGAYLVSQQQLEPAVGALLQAIDRDPTDFLSINRLLRTFKALDQPQNYQRWEERTKSLLGTVTANNKIPAQPIPDVDAIDELASYLYVLDRRLEAVLWKSLEAHYRNLPRAALEHWNRQRQICVAGGTDFPNQASRLCGLKLADYPQGELPEADPVVAREDRPAEYRTLAAPAEFENIAAKVGMKHRFRLGPEDPTSGFTMYQQAGGGVAVLDYDRDGVADLYFAQGGASAPQFRSELANPLLRGLGDRFSAVTAYVGEQDHRYTIGCTAGDWNQDGFEDLVVANIGTNYLLINNGDGSFRPQPLPGSDSLQRMPASVALADLDGDHLPDLVEVNYIDDTNIAKTPQRNDQGRVIEPVGPGDFDAAADRIGIQQPGGEVTFRSIGKQGSDTYTGLGVVIADFNGDDRNDVFVGNDKQPNQLWVRDPDTGNWTDIAAANGSASSFRGASTASMGIATADFDHSSTPDLHITNFQNESVCLYLNRGSYFQDRAAQYGLEQASRSVLGFGCQSIDYDNDGWLDLVVTNGHIDDTEAFDGDFYQPAQLFANLGNRFELISVVDRSGYWSGRHLGRALARVDFNRDGKNDFVVTHLGADSALLLNQSPTANHWLQLQLVGVNCERDAVGAKITVQAGQQQWTDWMIAGDGYLCRNEPVVSFGLGQSTVADRVTIRWPGSEQQTFEDVSADQRVMVIQGRPEIHVVP